MDDHIYIFLDVDGVLNKSSQWSRMYSLNEQCIRRFSLYAKSLSKPILIVLSSSWKRGYDPAGHHSFYIKKLLDLLSSEGFSVIGKTNNDLHFDRAKEINDFITEHKLIGSECIVIDDDISLFQSSLLRNCKLILTDETKGFVMPPIRQNNL